MTRLLMSPPAYFGVFYEINPWMDRRRAVDGELAWGQWRRLYQVLTQEVRAQVELLPAAPGCPDLVFTANAGLVVDGQAVLSRFRHPERQGEEPHVLGWFRDTSLRLLSLPPDVPFEGEGDALLAEGRLLLGYGFRTEARAAEELERVTGTEVIPLELVDPWFYHLDTCLAPLREGRALWCPEAFSRQARQRLAALFPELIPVPRQEALLLACNAVVVEQEVVVSAGCPITHGLLEERGYRVHLVDLSQFLRAGGGAKCLVLFLERPQEEARPAEEEGEAKEAQPLAL